MLLVVYPVVHHPPGWTPQLLGMLLAALHPLQELPQLRELSHAGLHPYSRRPASNDQSNKTLKAWPLPCYFNTIWRVSWGIPQNFIIAHLHLSNPASFLPSFFPLVLIPRISLINFSLSPILRETSVWHYLTSKLYLMCVQVQILIQ